MRYYEKIIELMEADDQQAIDNLNAQSVDLQIKAIDQQIDLLNKKKQELINQKKGV
jgi:hypothetical protein